MILDIERIESPIGGVLIASHDGAICSVEFDDTRERMRRLLGRHFGDFETRDVKPGKFAAAMRTYFDGDVEAIDGLPVTTRGTEFQERAWKALRAIPAGVTKSYGEQAASMGKPLAARAVGLANHLNPVGIVVPCHRVRGADGSLTGYAGGLERKRWLIAHEARFSAASSAGRRSLGR